MVIFGVHDFESNQCSDWHVEAQKASLGASIAYSGEYRPPLVKRFLRIIFLTCQQREVGFHCSGVWRNKGKSFTKQFQQRLCLYMQPNDLPKFSYVTIDR